ncbi:ankyrin repeat domain-containing protein [archaeon]|nr:MAG: ankyrin repeat domain-containing protein [archaeon]
MTFNGVSSSHNSISPLLLLPIPSLLISLPPTTISNPQDETLLTHCIKHQHIPAIQQLLHCGADPNIQSRRGITPISVGAHKGSVEIVQMLIDKGASVNSVNNSGSTALIQVGGWCGVYVWVWV